MGYKILGKVVDQPQQETQQETKGAYKILGSLVQSVGATVSDLGPAPEGM